MYVIMKLLFLKTIVHIYSFQYHVEVFSYKTYVEWNIYSKSEIRCTLHYVEVSKVMCLQHHKPLTTCGEHAEMTICHDISEHK